MKHIKLFEAFDANNKLGVMVDYLKKSKLKYEVELAKDPSKMDDIINLENSFYIQVTEGDDEPYTLWRKNCNDEVMMGTFGNPRITVEMYKIEKDRATR